MSTHVRKRGADHRAKSRAPGMVPDRRPIAWAQSDMLSSVALSNPSVRLPGPILALAQLRLGGPLLAYRTSTSTSHHLTLDCVELARRTDWYTEISDGFQSWTGLGDWLFPAAWRSQTRGQLACLYSRGSWRQGSVDDGFEQRVLESRRLLCEALPASSRRRSRPRRVVGESNDVRAELATLGDPAWVKQGAPPRSPRWAVCQLRIADGRSVSRGISLPWTSCSRGRALQRFPAVPGAIPAHPLSRRVCRRYTRCAGATEHAPAFPAFAAVFAEVFAASGAAGVAASGAGSSQPPAGPFSQPPAQGLSQPHSPPVAQLPSQDFKRSAASASRLSKMHRENQPARPTASCRRCPRWDYDDFIQEFGARRPDGGNRSFVRDLDRLLVGREVSLHVLRPQQHVDDYRSLPADAARAADQRAGGTLRTYLVAPSRPSTTSCPTDTSPACCRGCASPTTCRCSTRSRRTCRRTRWRMLPRAACAKIQPGIESAVDGGAGAVPEGDHRRAQCRGCSDTVGGTGSRRTGTSLSRSPASAPAIYDQVSPEDSQDSFISNHRPVPSRSGSIAILRTSIVRTTTR